MKIYLCLSSLSYLLLLGFPLLSALSSNNKSHRKVSFKTEDDALIEGSFFKGEKALGIIFTHGMVFNKESWHPVAGYFQEHGFACLAIDFRGYGNSKSGKSNEIFYDVLGAIDYLEDNGFEHIALIGGSMGASAILRALSHTSDPKIEKVILLAPAGGNPVKSQKIKKLFIVSEKDGFYSTVNSLFEASSDPKMLKVYPGSSHAQHMFKTEHGTDLTNLMIRFLQED